MRWKRPAFDGSSAPLTPATSAASSTAPARRELGGSEGKPAVRSPNGIGTRAWVNGGEGAGRDAGGAGEGAAGDARAGSAGDPSVAGAAASSERGVAGPACAGRARNGSSLTEESSAASA